MTLAKCCMRTGTCRSSTSGRSPRRAELEAHIASGEAGDKCARYQGQLATRTPFVHAETPGCAACRPAATQPACCRRRIRDAGRAAMGCPGRSAHSRNRQEAGHAGCREPAGGGDHAADAAAQVGTHGPALLTPPHRRQTAWDTAAAQHSELSCAESTSRLCSACSMRLVPTQDISRHLIVEVDSGVALQVRSVSRVSNKERWATAVV